MWGVEGIRRPSFTKEAANNLVLMLRQLFDAQNPTGENLYLREHSQPNILASHVHAFCWYACHLPERGTVLDWGCNHGPDSCLLRTTFGDNLELRACDVGEPARFSAFFAHTRLSDSALSRQDSMRSGMQISRPHRQS